MPEGVGFFVGPSSDHYAVMQIHYGQPSGKLWTPGVYRQAVTSPLVYVT